MKSSLLQPSFTLTLFAGLIMILVCSQETHAQFSQAFNGIGKAMPRAQKLVIKPKVPIPNIARPKGSMPRRKPISIPKTQPIKGRSVPVKEKEKMDPLDFMTPHQRRMYEAKNQPKGEQWFDNVDDVFSR